MNITRETIKETLKAIMAEESDYQTFFKKALEKAGKSIPSMSDEEKKEFFNKIDAAWNAKGEKNEELKGNQHKLDVDGDGEIEASDLAALRAGKKKEESTNEGKDFKRVKKDKYGNHLEPQFKKGDKVTYLGNKGVITGVNKESSGVYSYNVDYYKGNGRTKASNIFNKGGELNFESVNEEETFTATNKETGNVAVFKSKDARDAAVKAGTHDAPEKSDDGEKTSKDDKPNMFSKDTGYDAGGDSEPKKKTGLSGFIQRMRDKQKEKELADRRYPDFKKDAIIVSAIDKNDKKVEWMTDMSREEITDHMNKKVEDGEAKSYQLMRFNYYYRPVPIDESAGCSCGCGGCSESLNEAASDRDFEKVFNIFNKKDYFHLKGSIKTMLGNWQRALDRGDKGAQQYSKEDIIDSVTAQTKARAKNTYDELVKAIKNKDIKALKSKLRHDQKFSLAIFTQVTGKKLPKSTRDIHSFLDNEFMSESVNENAYKAWLKRNNMKDNRDNQSLYYYLLKKHKSVSNFPKHYESVNEGRAFVQAARKAKEEGKTEFEFNGKTYPVTLKEESINERRLGKVDLLRSVEDGETSRVEGVKISKDLAFELRMFLQRPLLARTRTGIAIDNAQMKDAIPMLAKVGVHKRLSSGVKKEFADLLKKYK